MVHASRRTTGCLALTATIFIIVIIILCVIPSKPGRTAKDSPKSQENVGDVITDSTSTRASDSTVSSVSTSTTSSTKAPTDTPTEIPTISTTASTTTTDKELEASTRSTLTSTSTTSTSTSTSTSTTSTSTSTSTSTASTTSSTSTSTASTTASTSTTDNSQEVSTSSTSTEKSTTSTITSTSTTDSLVEADSTDASTETSTTSTTDNLLESTDASNETSTTSTTDHLLESTDASTETSTASTTDHLLESTDASTETSTTSTTDHLLESTEASTETSTTSTTASTSTTDHLLESTEASTEASTTSTTAPTSTTEQLLESTDASTETSTTSTTASTSTTDNLAETDSTDAPTETSTTSTTISPPMIGKGTSDVCTTPDCKNFASRMLHLMDHRGAPCEDFYHYACGSLERDDFLLAEDPQQPVDKMIQNILSTTNRKDHPTEQLQLYYKSCLNYIQNSNETQRRLGAANLVNEIGYPVSIYNTYQRDTTKALATLMMLQFSPIIDVKLDIDGSDNTKFAISLTPPVTESVFSDNQAKAHCLGKYNKEEERARRDNNVLDIDQAYENYKVCMEKDGLHSEIETIIKSLDFFGLDDHFNSEIEEERNTSSRDAGDVDVAYLRPELLEDMRQFIKEILLVLRKDVPSCRLQIAKKEYEERDFQELASMIDENIIDWEELMRELLGQEIDPDTKVQIYCKDQLSNVFNMLKEIHVNSSRAIPNMLAYMWSGRVYSDFISPTGKTLSSKEYCFDATKVLLDDLVSFNYLQELPNQPFLQQKIEKMVANLSETAEKQLAWIYLSSASPSDLLTNVMSLKVEGINKTAMEEDILNTSHKINMTSDDFLGNSQALLRRYGQRRFGFFDKSPEEENIKWKQFTLPHAARGITLYGPNTLLVPYASLAPPLFYDQSLPSFVNFGGFGHLIAQEMMERLDVTGLMEGSRHSDNYKNMSQCLGEQLELPQNTSTDGLHMNFMLNSTLFIYDVLADSAATRLALDTFTKPSKNERMQWMEEMTPEQLFFLRVAQSQCASNGRMSMLDIKEDINLPPQLRVNLVLRNEPNFQSAFHCPPDSPMVADTQCPFTLPL